MVYAKPPIFLKRMVKVIPPRILAFIVIYLPKDVDKSPFLYVLYRLTLGLCKMELVLPKGRFPDIQFVRRDVKVAAKQNLFIQVKILVKISS